MQLTVLRSCGAAVCQLPVLPSSAGTIRAVLQLVGVRQFTELRAWQLAAELRDRIVAVTARPHFRTDLRFRDQLRGAACSSPRLIAEGFGRFGRRELRRYLTMARAS